MDAGSGGKAAELDVSGPAVSGATGYRAEWKMGSGTTKVAKFYVYYDPDADAASPGASGESQGLLADVDTTYVETEGTATVCRVAGVTNSVLPRFFLAPPTQAG